MTLGAPLRVGQAIPDFQAQDATGARRTRHDIVGAPFVLYFYPADETPGCIAEGCAYRDHWHEFQALGIHVYGVSRDSVESHVAFAAHRRLPYTLLSDPDGSMTERFGATMLGGLPRRISYLVDARGVVAAVFDSHLRPAAHAEKMLEAARRL